jgi:hypothetical protein
MKDVTKIFCVMMFSAWCIPLISMERTPQLSRELWYCVKKQHETDLIRDKKAYDRLRAKFINSKRKHEHAIVRCKNEKLYQKLAQSQQLYDAREATLASQKRELTRKSDYGAAFP